MFGSMRKITLAGLAGAATFLTAGQNAHAGPIIDWLLGRPILVYPSPYVAGYAGVPAAAPLPAMPVAVSPTAQTYYAPSYSASAPCAVAAAHCPVPTAITVSQPVISAPVAQPVVVGYAPTYRTNWNRVPVTYYRPAPTYNTAGYPAAGAVPCNTYAWQAQRVPTTRYRPWIPFAPTTYGYARAPTTYGYAPVPTTYGYAPAPTMYGYVPVPTTYGYAPVPTTYGYPMVPNAMTVVPAATPACQACPVAVTAPNSWGVGNFAPATPSAPAVPAFGVSPAGATLGVPAPMPDSGYSAPPADQAPTLLPGNYPVSPASDTSVPSAASALGSGPAPATSTSADSASTRRESNSPYRVTPIPAPDVRTFESQRTAPQAPPLLQERERTVFNSGAQRANIENTSWVTKKQTPTAPAATVNPSTAKPLWNDGGWRSVK